MDVLIIGAGGHGKVVLDILRAAGKHKPIGFVDADPSLLNTTVSGLPVIAQSHQLNRSRTKAKGAIVAIGDNRARRQYARMLADEGFELVNAIHPSAVVSPSATVGQNVVICANATICAEAKIGDSAVINTAAVVDHECVIEEGVHIAPGVCLAGRVTVHAGAMVGLGSRVIQCLNIGPESVVGAGAVIIRNVPAGATVVGVPGKILKQSS